MNPRSQPLAAPSAWLCAAMLSVVVAGCGDDPAGEPGAAAATPPVADGASVSPDSEDFRRQAHQKALASLREQSTKVLRLLDPVANARADAAPLTVPRVGPAARTSVRKPLTIAQREAAGIKRGWLSPEDGVVLRMHLTGLDRGFERSRAPAPRDGPDGVLYTLAPYLGEVERRMALGQCEDGCGLDSLASALRVSMAEVGSASVPTIGAAQRDFAALHDTVGYWAKGRPPEHPVAKAAVEITAELETIDATLATAYTALVGAPTVDWKTIAPAAPAAEWKRRPDRWNAARLRRFLGAEEAYGHPADALFERAVVASERLHLIRERDAAAATSKDEPAAAAPAMTPERCEALLAPLAEFTKQPDNHLVAELDCTALAANFDRRVPEASDSIAQARAVIRHGVVEPTRDALLKDTPIDLRLVWGRAAAPTQATMLEVAIAAGTEQPALGARALADGHRAACLAAIAVWIHGELGTDAILRDRLDPQGCGDLDAMIAEAQARPRAALQGLGWLLLGQGPADAAALDRYWWAPLGLVRDLAMPPPPRREQPTKITVEPLPGREP